MSSGGRRFARPRAVAAVMPRPSTAEAPARPGRALLAAAAAFSGMAAVLHLACLAIGAPMFRLMGAGEQMAQLHLAGHWYPTVVTLLIAAVLLGWSAYALSGAGVIGRLPLLRTALCAITTLYLLRGVAVVPVMAYFPGNSAAFWWASSALCVLIGLVHLFGLRQSWARLSRTAG